MKMSKAVINILLKQFEKRKQINLFAIYYVYLFKFSPHLAHLAFLASSYATSNGVDDVLGALKDLTF